MTFITLALEWLLDLDGPALFREYEDLSYEDYEDEIKMLSDEEVRDAVQRHYDGGWDTFERVNADDVNEWREAMAVAF